MVERNDYEPTSPEQTLETFRAGANMFLAGKDLAFQKLEEHPFIPNLEELGEHVGNAIPDINSLTEWQRSFLLVNGLMQTYQVMARRADYQAKWSKAPERVKENLLYALQSSTNHELILDPDSVSFHWSLFSVSLVADKEGFDKAKKYFLGKKKNIHGFISRFATELGRMPIVRKGKDYRSTIWHEDIHVWQENMGYGGSHFDLLMELEKPAVQRAVYDENIRQGDYEKSSTFLDSVLSLAERETRIELPAYLWNKNLPSVDILDNPDYNELNFAHIALVNTIYADATGFSNSERVQKHFEAIMKISNVDLERRKLLATARQATREYKGPHNRWEWIAAAATVLPPDFSPNLFKGVVLGRQSSLLEEPEIHYPTHLAAVLVTHARRLVHPEPYGEGGEIPRELVNNFWEKTAEVFNERSLYSEILDKYRLTDSVLPLTKRNLIKFASKSVPQGFRGKTKRELKRRLK